MKNGKRLYINLTNKCNTSCPFCCMYCNEKNDRFITFEQIKSIIDGTEELFELQLEGGEPLLHENIFLFIEYAIATKRCSKVIILTNGILLEKYMQRFIELANWYNIEFEIKVSINYWLLEKNKNHIKNLSNLAFAIKYMPYISMIFNVRKRIKDDNNIDFLLRKYKIFDLSNIYYFQSYGKLKNTKYDKPIIVQNIKDWSLYASDGKCFGQDLVARSEYEHEYD